MLSRSFLRLAARPATSLRPLSTSSARLAGGDDPAKPMSQGHATRKAGQPDGGLDVQSHQVQRGAAAAEHGSGAVHDTAAQDKGGEAQPSQVAAEERDSAETANQRAASGSFKDHRGSAQSTGDQSSGSVGGKSEATPPSATSAVKQALGMGTSKGDHKESKTVPGRQRDFSTSARRAWPAPGGDGSAAVKSDSEGARKPHDTSVEGDQNPHLKHRKEGEKDHGKGNAAEDPSLPSKKRSGQ